MKTNRAIALSILILAAAVAGAQSVGSFSSVTGKVEYQAPSGSWKAAKVGDSIAAGGIVSVGFKSSAVIKTVDASITVKALTRLAIEDIVATEGGTRTSLRLSTGSIRTEVTAPAGSKSAFSVRSPTATASVRGTGFDFDGMNLSVLHGSVDLRNNWGRRRAVGAGYAALVLSTGTVAAPFAAPRGGFRGLARRARRLNRAFQGTNLPLMARLPALIALAAQLPDMGAINITVPTESEAPPSDAIREDAGNIRVR